MKQAAAHNQNANNADGGGTATSSNLQAPLPQRFKIYTDSSDNSLDSDENDRKNWMLVSQKKNNDSDATDSNEEADHTATRIRLQNSLMTGSDPVYRSAREVVLQPKKLKRGIDDKSLPSTPIDGVQTDESKSVSGELEESDNASDNSHDLFNAVLDDLNSYTVVRDAEDCRQFRDELQQRSGLTPEEEALISLSMCNEDLAALNGMGIHYPTGLDDETDIATGFYGIEEEQMTAPLDPGEIWNGMLRVIQYFVKPTQKSLAEMKAHAEKTYKEWAPVLHNSKFQVAVALTIVAVFTAAKVMDRSRLRNPIPIVRQLKNQKVSEDTLEAIFAALAAHKHPTQPFY